MVGVGVIGMGEIGRVFAKAIAECPSAMLSIGCDVDGRQRGWAGDTFGIPTTSQVEDVLACKDVDVVAICLPHDLHFAVGSAALTAGKHVLLEKPMATTVKECDQLVAAAAKANLVVGVDHNRLFAPSHIKARELIISGAIGEPVLLRQRLSMHEPYTGWRADPRRSGGGLLSDAGAHPFYVARYLFGEIAGVWSLLDVPPAEGESLAIVWMEFESGARGLLEGSYWGPTGMFDDGIEVVGGDGVLRLGGLEAITWGYRSDAPMEMYRNREWKPVNVDFVDWEETVILSVKAFLKALDQGNKVPATGEDGRENVRLIQAAYDNASFLGSFTRPSLRA